MVSEQEFQLCKWPLTKLDICWNMLYNNRMFFHLIMKQNIIKPEQLKMQSRFKSFRIHSCFTYKYSWTKKVDKFNGFCTSNTYSPYLSIPYKVAHQVCQDNLFLNQSTVLVVGTCYSIIHSPLRSLPFLKQVKHRLEKKAQPWDSTFVKTKYNQPDNCIIYFKIVFKHVFCCYGNSRWY